MSMLPHDRRSSARIETARLVIHTQEDPDGKPLWQGIAVTLDLNEFGMRLQCPDELPVGGRFRFSVAVDEEIVLAAGRVVHAQQALNGTWELGVEFLEIGAEPTKIIRGLVEKNRADR